MPRCLPRLVILVILLAYASASRAAYDFGPWAPGTSPEEIGRRISANFLPRPHMLLGRDPVIHYAEVCTWYGALTFARLSHDTALRAKLVDRFEPFFREEKSLIPTPQHVDWTVFGAVPLEIFMQNQDLRCLALGEWMAQRQWGEPFGNKIEPRAHEHLAKGLSWQTRLWIDDMFMITLVQLQAFRATGNRLYFDRAAKEVIYYLDELQQPGGLFYHKPDVPFYWGRGNGWMAVGLAEILRSFPADHPDRPRIMQCYQRMMEALLKNQDAGGLWHQLIDGPDSYLETSATGMFTFAFITGVKEGWLDEKTYGPAARKGWLALVGYLDAEANLREVCNGTGAKNDREYYLNRPRITGDFHGQAPVLWCASALLR